ncbi:MAG TPA: hypothetical protein VND89_09090 [Acidimicrobiales bacterium]|nr:hypothetical protein [Acidimicrobiales bacterium]
MRRSRTIFAAKVVLSEIGEHLTKLITTSPQSCHDSVRITLLLPPFSTHGELVQRRALAAVTEPGFAGIWYAVAA